MLIFNEKSSQDTSSTQDEGMARVTSRSSGSISSDSSSSSGKSLGSPPPYQDTAASPPSSSLANSPPSGSLTQARTNYLEIIESHRDIKGSWVIDTSLVIPQSLLESQKWDLKDGARPNLNIISKSGVKGDITLSGPSEDLAIVRIEAEHGNVKVRIINKTRQRLQFSCFSSLGSVSIALPPSFKGNVECSTGQGKVKNSDHISRNLTQFSSVHGKVLGFLSPEPIPSGPGGTAAFNNAPDSLAVVVKHGDVKLRYAEEETLGERRHRRKERRKERRSKRKGLLRKLFS